MSSLLYSIVSIPTRRAASDCRRSSSSLSLTDQSRLASQYPTAGTTISVTSRTSHCSIANAPLLTIQMLVGVDINGVLFVPLSSLGIHSSTSAIVICTVLEVAVLVRAMTICEICRVAHVARARGASSQAKLSLDFIQSGGRFGHHLDQSFGSLPLLSAARVSMRGLQVGQSAFLSTEA